MISMEELMRRGDVNINTVDRDGKTVLMYQTDPNVIEKLITMGADINATNKLGMSVLMIQQDPIAVEKLIDLGADINAVDKIGRTVLMHQSNNPMIVEKLITMGVDINAKDNNGNTILSNYINEDESLIIFSNQNSPIAKQMIELLVRSGATGNTQYKRIHDSIGRLEGYGDRDAPYQIEMGQFVLLTQYRPIKPEDSEELKSILENDPKPHVVYACPSGHFHWSEACGIPTQVDRCGRDTPTGPCTMLVGGVHHLLCPGTYVVYHDGYDVAKVFYGNFPAYTYSSYLKLIDQHNMAVELYNRNKYRGVITLYPLEPIEEKMPEDVATKINSDDYKEVIIDQGGCSICGDEFDMNNNYYLLKCNHLLCEECLMSARQGDLSNIMVGTEEDLAMRKCGIAGCGKRFHFTFGQIQQRKLYHQKKTIQTELCILM